MNLRLGDLPTGWTAESLSPDEAGVCRGFHPDESKLTLTGISNSPAFGIGTSATPSSLQATFSATRVWSTAAQAKTAFDLEARIGQLACVGDLIQGADPSEVAVVSSGRLTFPQLGRGARAFRVVIADKRGGGAGSLYTDVVVLLGGRSTVTMGFQAIGKAPTLELPLARVLADRAKRV